MLPTSHVSYTWLALSLAQEHLEAPADADYRLAALAAMGSDLFDKPLAWAYFYKHHKSAVLFAHTLIAYALVAGWGVRRDSSWRLLAAAFVGHAVLDRIWLFHDTFYWPLRGWRFHTWGKQGSEQEAIGRAYWFAFTRRPELWGWEAGGLVALVWFILRHKLYRWERLRKFVLTGRVRAPSRP